MGKYAFELVIPLVCVMDIDLVVYLGEQSVGKSYALNHLVDTSFAGSAMRTTGWYQFSNFMPQLTIWTLEGVWMSVTPTSDALLVALDFEGKKFSNYDGMFCSREP